MTFLLCSCNTCRIRLTNADFSREQIAGLIRGARHHGSISVSGDHRLMGGLEACAAVTVWGRGAGGGGEAKDGDVFARDLQPSQPHVCPKQLG